MKPMSLENSVRSNIHEQSQLHDIQFYSNSFVQAVIEMFYRLRVLVLVNLTFIPNYFIFFFCELQKCKDTIFTKTFVVLSK